jgi:hypothetical protein
MSGVTVPVIAADRARLPSSASTRQRLSRARSRLTSTFRPSLSKATQAARVRASENSRLLVVGSRETAAFKVFCSVRSATGARCTLAAPCSSFRPLVNDRPPPALSTAA